MQNLTFRQLYLYQQLRNLLLQMCSQSKFQTSNIHDIRFLKSYNNSNNNNNNNSYNTNHKNYNFLACDWFKKVLFSTDSLAKLLSDSLLLDSLLLDSLLSDSSISQSLSKMQFKSTNHIQSRNDVCARALAFVFLPVALDVYASFVNILMRIFSFFHNLAIFLFLGNCNFYG